MFYQTSFLLLAILVTAVVVRVSTVAEHHQNIHKVNRFNDNALKRKLFIAKLTIIFLAFSALMLWARLPNHG